MEEILPMAELEDSLKNHIPQQQYRDLYNLAETRLPPSCDLQPRLFTDHMTHSSSYDSKNVSTVKQMREKLRLAGVHEAMVSPNSMKTQPSDSRPKIDMFHETVLFLVMTFGVSYYMGLWELVPYGVTCITIDDSRQSADGQQLHCLTTLGRVLMMSYLTSDALILTAAITDVTWTILMVIFTCKKRHSSKSADQWDVITDKTLTFFFRLAFVAFALLCMTLLLWTVTCHVYGTTMIYGGVPDFDISPIQDEFIAFVVKVCIFRVVFHIVAMAVYRVWNTVVEGCCFATKPMMRPHCLHRTTEETVPHYDQQNQRVTTTEKTTPEVDVV